MPGQYPPPGDWPVWLLIAGRGFGKTRAGAEWVRMRALANAGMRIALVGATMDDARAVMVEGESGLLAVSRDTDGVEWQPGSRRLVWRNGSVATLFSAGSAGEIAWAAASYRLVRRAGEMAECGAGLGQSPARAAARAQCADSGDDDTADDGAAAAADRHAGDGAERRFDL